MVESAPQGCSIRPRITFGMNVLNGEPFLRYKLRSVYPWAHQIFVVEGACRAGSAIADVKGHSTDGTRDILALFKQEEDPDNKLTVVTAEDEGHPDGFWPGEKHEMSQAFAKRTTGEFLWEAGIDEFYRDEDMPRILDLLQHGADTITFPTLSFWGGLQFMEDGQYMRAYRGREVDRVFRWGPHFRYITHRPPTVVDARGRDLRRLHWVTSRRMEREGIYMYHYSLLVPKQVQEKCAYYSRVDWAPFNDMERWAQEVFMEFKRPFAVTNNLHVPLSWLDEYNGPHPAPIQAMVENIRAGRHPGIELRPTDDIQRVLQTPAYRRGRALRRFWVAIQPLHYTVWPWYIRAGLFIRRQLKRFGLKLPQRGAIGS